MIFKKEPDFDQLHSNLALSFNHLRQDTAQIFSWLNFLHQELQQQRAHLQHLHQKVQDFQTTLPHSQQEFNHLHFKITSLRSEIISIIDDKHSQFHSKLSSFNQQIDFFQQRIKNLENARQELLKLNHRLNQVVEQHQPLVEKVDQLHQKVEKKPFWKRKSHSSHQVKGAILSLISKYGRVSGTRLRELIVNEQKLCSRSTFYRLLNEIEEMDALSVVSEGKEKFFIHTPTKVSY